MEARGRVREFGNEATSLVLVLLQGWFVAWSRKAPSLVTLSQPVQPPQSRVLARHRPESQRQQGARSPGDSMHHCGCRVIQAPAMGAWGNEVVLGACGERGARDARMSSSQLRLTQRYICHDDCDSPDMGYHAEETRVDNPFRWAK